MWRAGATSLDFHPDARRFAWSLLRLRAAAAALVLLTAATRYITLL